MGEVAVERKKVLVVDDEKSIRDSLRLLLKSSFEVSTAEDGIEALAIVDTFRPDLILLDIMMPKLDGMGTLKELRDRENRVPVIVLTGNSTVPTAVQAMKLGAVDYLNKPFDVGALTTMIVTILEKGGAKPEARPPAASPALPADFGGMVGKSPPMRELFQKVEQVAARDTTVLITGESGTGKELVALRIHDLSARRGKPFVPINCAAIPETLIESELFGHEKGAFTSAIEQRLGHFELADGGTIFLDEIGELSLAVQVKMLRFLQEHEFYRVGRSKPVHVDVRVIAATNKRLEDLTREKKFRQDLYYRVNVINLEIPPLRDRFEDIPALVDHFVAKYSAVYGARKMNFAREAMNVLVEYAWPGNVRELENVIESLLALCPQDQIDEAALPMKLKLRSTEKMSFNIFEGSLNFQDAERVFETEMIVKALRKTNYVQTRAAELLGISRRILKYKMDKLGITEEPEPAPPAARPPEP